MARIIAHAARPLQGRIMFNVVLFQPQIPPNTGNIIRLCANSGSTLHLVKPLGFELTRRAVRRAGLDYDELTVVHVHADLGDCLQALGAARLYSIETSARAPLQRGAAARRRCAVVRTRDLRPARRGARARAATAAAA